MDIQKMKEKPWAYGTFSAFTFGVLTHIFALVNILHNYDDIAQQPTGYGTGITSGRFVLTILGDFISQLGGNRNLPVVNGLIFIVFIAAAAGLLVITLNIKSKGFSVAIGMLFAAFPTATATLLFRYTAGYYGLGILLAVAAAWAGQEKNWGGVALSALCTALALGIYQAYAPITITIMILLLIQRVVSRECDWKEVILAGVKYCACLILGLVLYYILLKLTLVLYRTELSDYQGMSQMGKFSLKELPALLYRAAYSFVWLPLRDYCGLASSKLVKIGWLSVYCLSIGIAAYEVLFKIRKVSAFLMLLGLGLLLAIAANFIVVMCPDSWIYTLMVYSFAIVPCLLIVLYEAMASERGKRGKRILSGIIAGVITVMSLCYGYQANVNYTAVYYAGRQVENYMTSLVTQVRMTDGFDTEKKWAFIGDIEDPLLNCYWQYELTIGGVEFTQLLLNRYSRMNWIQNYYGYLPPMASDEELEELANDERVQEMPCWPNEGSIQVIEDMVVVKFQDISDAQETGE